MENSHSPLPIQYITQSNVKWPTKHTVAHMKSSLLHLDLGSAFSTSNQQTAARLARDKMGRPNPITRPSRDSILHTPFHPPDTIMGKQQTFVSRWRIRNPFLRVDT
jgi:hypothetical protein